MHLNYSVAWDVLLIFEVLLNNRWVPRRNFTYYLTLSVGIRIVMSVLAYSEVR